MNCASERLISSHKNPRVTRPSANFCSLVGTGADSNSARTCRISSWNLTAPRTFIIWERRLRALQKTYGCYANRATSLHRLGLQKRKQLPNSLKNLKPQKVATHFIPWEAM